MELTIITAASDRTEPTQTQRLGNKPHPRRAAVSLLCLGLALTVTAATVAHVALAEVGTATDLGPVPVSLPAQPIGTGPLLVRGPGDVGVTTVVYEPGQSSGWHAHGGMEAIAVVAGELTVYDRECRPQRVAPGAPYVGGQELHLTRNDSAAPVDMVVTYLKGTTASPADSAKPVAPSGCAVR